MVAIRRVVASLVPWLLVAVAVAVAAAVAGRRWGPPPEFEPASAPAPVVVEPIEPGAHDEPELMPTGSPPHLRMPMRPKMRGDL